MQRSSDLRTIKTEIKKTRKRLQDLEIKYQMAKHKGSPSEKERMADLIRELKKENSSVKLTLSKLNLLKFVGTLPYSSAENDREDISNTIASEYNS